MSKTKELIVSSCKEFKNLKAIILAALFGAISIVLSSLAIMLTPTMRISFTFLPNEFVYYLFGPAFGSVFGAVMDVLGWIASPKGAYFPGFTVSGVVTGLIYGFIMYKRPITLQRVILANVIRSVVVDFFMNTYWLSILMHTTFEASASLRIWKIIIMLPIETVLLYLVIKTIEASGILNLLRSNEYKTR